MILVITMVAVLVLGHELTLRIWRRDVMTAWERATYAAAIGVLVWIASVWSLSLMSLLRREAVIGRTALLVAIAATLLIRRRGEIRNQLAATYDSRAAAILILAFTPLMAWIVFALWRGALLPPLNHDALWYHMTKAALFVKAMGYRTFEDLSFVVPPRASNYEMLLADAMAGDRTDRFTEWPSVVFYLGFITGGVALAQRWWRIGTMSSATTALLLAGVPVVLLHSAAHKNDLMFTFLVVCAFVAIGRAVSDDDAAAFALSIACFGAAAGTKNHGAAVALLFTPLAAWWLFRRFSLRRLALAAGVGVLSLVLLGGLDQIVKLIAPKSAAVAPLYRVGVPKYGHWHNLWQGPYVLIAAPFSRSSGSLSVPWEENSWYWRRYELFFSEFGIVFSVAAVALPFVLLRLWRRRDERRLERYAVTASALGVFVVLLPVAYYPVGLYHIYLPRFVMFLVPIVFAWTVSLLAETIAQSRPRAVKAVLLAAAGVFTLYAASNGIEDTFAPIDYVMWVRNNPGTRTTAFDPNRAELRVDRVASPRDTILIDAGLAAWVYPAYGRNLERDVRYVTPGDGPVVIDDDVDWIVIDRSYSATWSHPDFKTLGQAGQYLTRAIPRPEDSRVLKAASQDPRFKLVHVNPRGMQAVFQRVR